MSAPNPEGNSRSWVGAVVGFALANPLAVWLGVAALVVWGVAVAPFDWRIPWFPRSPVAVDAIPNLGENQQIVTAEWPGASPQDVHDQLTYPLSTALMGVAGVKEVRTLSMLGFAQLYLVFAEDVEFYWARSRILEKLASLPPGVLPAGVQPNLGPDATPLGQVFWYTLEGRDPDGRPLGGWDLHELRSFQDFTVRWAVQGAEGVAEVATVGGQAREYVVEVDPDALRVAGVTLQEVVRALEEANVDVGAGVVEMNRVEYAVRGRGLVQGVMDLEEVVLRVGGRHTPVRVGDVAAVTLGPAPRRGVLTVGGAEAVGGVVVVREGYNPLAAINNVKQALAELAPGLPVRAVVDWGRVDRKGVEALAATQGFAAFRAGTLNHDGWVEFLQRTPRENWPPWVTLSQLTVVPVYDRTGLIREVLGTLNDALVQQVLVTVLVVLVLLGHLRAAAVLSVTLPLAVLGGFVAMKVAGVDANVVSLAGIAIAIGTIVDMGIIVTDNALRHLAAAPPGANRRQVIARATAEVGGAVASAIATTVVSFLPVFTMTGAEGKMFTPLAYTKTFVLVASLVVALLVVPVLLTLALGRGGAGKRLSLRAAVLVGLAVGVGALGVVQGWWAVVVAAGAVLALEALRGWGARWGGESARLVSRIGSFLPALLVAAALAWVWEPLGPERGVARNALFVLTVAGTLLGLYALLQRFYPTLLGWCLRHKLAFLALPVGLVVSGACVWLGFGQVFGFLPAGLERLGLGGEGLRRSAPWVWLVHRFPGMGREFMPSFDEGSFLWMPSTMPHASLGEVLEVLQFQDRAIAAIPEVEGVIGKLGRAESALDPAPTTMIETLITYKSEYIVDSNGRRLTFRFDRARGEFARDQWGQLIPDPRGRPFRQWRDHIRSPEDIWEEVVRAAALPGTTSAPRLQPIETRQVMLQTGMRAAMGVKVRAPDLATLERAALALEGALRRVPAVRPETVSAERVVGRPYLEVRWDRRILARYGLEVGEVQEVLGAAVGGVVPTTTREGRERYGVRVRYPRERRGDLEELEEIVVATPAGAHVPLGQLAEIAYLRGPDMIRSENTFLTAYVTFSGQPGLPEVEVVHAARVALEAMRERGELTLPAGVAYRFAGVWEQAQHAAATLRVVLPLSLGIIFLILYFQFRSVPVVLFIFGGILVAWAGGFVVMDLLAQPWFANVSLFGANLREVFQLKEVNLSVAVWVGFLALFGIAVDDGVLMATYLSQRFAASRPTTPERIREETILAGSRRVRAALATTATTVLALLPVLTSAGRGSEVMIPMALPTFGGMVLEVLTIFTVPVLYCWWQEHRLRSRLG